MVGDDDIGPLCLQMLPTGHFKSETQEILHVTNQEANNPEKEMVNYCPEDTQVTFCSGLRIKNHKLYIKSGAGGKQSLVKTLALVKMSEQRERRRKLNK